MLSLQKRRQIEGLSKKVSKFEDMLKEFVESEHPRNKDGEFTSGGGDSSSKESGSKSDSKSSNQKDESPKEGVGLFRKLVGVVLGVKGGSFVGGAVGTALMVGVGLHPIAAAASAAGVALYVGGKIYDAVTKAEITKAGSKTISFKSDADGKKFLEELPKHLDAKQLALVNQKLQALVDEHKK